jgi:hypothetical protein
MSVYVDNEQIEWKGGKWCHLVADSLDELHIFARKLGLRPSWFQVNASYPHYDITESLRQRALSLGARHGDRRTIITCARTLKVQLREISNRDTAQTTFSF